MDTGDDRPVAAGDFSSWLTQIQGAIGGDGVSDVPCAGCTACCTSSQFVHIGPDEADARSHIPRELLFPAPRLPPGHAVMGFDERGHCPMLIDNRCSIYQHRPRTCRTYDCRVFPATGVEVDGPQAQLARQVRRWRFSYPSPRDQAEHDAVRAAARFLAARPGLLTEMAVPAVAAQIAVLAIEIHRLFLGPDEPDPEVVRAEVLRRPGEVVR
jgi:Fe-S-cluster containining protein